jgi:cellobiose transport system substrate-binding protein
MAGRRARRRVATAATAVVLAAALAACGGGDDDNGGLTADGELPTGQTITVWTFGATGLEDSMEAWADDTGNKIEIKTSEYDAHHEQLLTALASGAVPDVAVVETAYSAQFKQSADYFTDLREFGADDIEGDYLDWRWAQGVADDGYVFGIPTDVGGMAMAYRTDLFESAGLPSDPADVEKLWTSWDEFLDAGRDYTTKTGEPWLDDTGVLYQTLVNQLPEKYYASEDELIYETNPGIESAFEMSVSAGDLSANLAAFTPEWNTAMAKGDYAVQLAPAWMLNYIQSQAPDTKGKWSVVNLPEGGGNWGGSQLTVPKASDNAALAYDMISTVLSPESQFEVFKTGGNFPSTPELFEKPELVDFTSDFFSGAPIGQIYADSAKALEPVYEGPKERQISRAFTDALDRTETGDESPDEAWSSALEEAAREVG